MTQISAAKETETKGTAVYEEKFNTIAGFHMTSLKFELQNYWSSWNFT